MITRVSRGKKTPQGVYAGPLRVPLNQTAFQGSTFPLSVRSGGKKMPFVEPDTDVTLSRQ